MMDHSGPPKTDAKPVRVAIAQSAPVYLDIRASLAKALNLVERAAKRGAGIVAFGETWLPGYPAWLDVCPGAALWQNPAAKDVFARLRSNSIVVPGEEVNLLSEAARDFKIAIVIGVNERVDSGPGNGTLYNSLLTISEDGVSKTIIESLFRPTPNAWFGEMEMAAAWKPRPIRRACGRIDLLGTLDAACANGYAQFRGAHSCRGMADSPRIAPIGQPTLRLRRPMFRSGGRVDDVASDLPREFQDATTSGPDHAQWIERGGSTIIGPDAQYVLDPVFDREELLVSDLDLAQIDREMMTFDASGHYARPDLFRFEKKV